MKDELEALAKKRSQEEKIRMEKSIKLLGSQMDDQGKLKELNEALELSASKQAQE
jgi:hypothetical protein